MRDNRRNLASQGGRMSEQAPATRQLEDDESILHRLGYAQVLYREMGGISNTAHALFVTYSGIIGLHLLLNLLGVNLLAALNSFSAWWHMIGVLVIVFVLIIVPDHHQSAGYVFGHTINNSGFQGHGFGN